MKHDFKVGDFVYYEESDDIGQITDVDSEFCHYRINYCQFKDPDRGTSGGNGPVFREGYPKPVTKLPDVLFVFAMKEREKIKSLESSLKEANKNFTAIKLARKLIMNTENDDEHERGL